MRREWSKVARPNVHASAHRPFVESIPASAVSDFISYPVIPPPPSFLANGWTLGYATSRTFFRFYFDGHRLSVKSLSQQLFNYRAEKRDLTAAREKMSVEEKRGGWRAFRVQWGAERCWRQIKADGDADKTVRERQRLLSTTPRPQ